MISKLGILLSVFLFVVSAPAAERGYRLVAQCKSGQNWQMNVFENTRAPGNFQVRALYSNPKQNQYWSENFEGFGSINIRKISIDSYLGLQSYSLLKAFWTGDFYTGTMQMKFENPMLNQTLPVWCQLNLNLPW